MILHTPQCCVLKTHCAEVIGTIRYCRNCTINSHQPQLAGTIQGHPCNGSTLVPDYTASRLQALPIERPSPSPQPTPRRQKDQGTYCCRPDPPSCGAPPCQPNPNQPAHSPLPKLASFPRRRLPVDQPAGQEGCIDSASSQHPLAHADREGGRNEARHEALELNASGIWIKMIQVAMTCGAFHPSTWGNAIPGAKDREAINKHEEQSPAGRHWLKDAASM